jgi:hypothetical protein
LLPLAQRQALEQVPLLVAPKGRLRAAELSLSRPQPGPRLQLAPEK